MTSEKQLLLLINLLMVKCYFQTTVLGLHHSKKSCRKWLGQLPIFPEVDIPTNSPRSSDCAMFGEMPKSQIGETSPA